MGINDVAERLDETGHHGLNPLKRGMGINAAYAAYLDLLTSRLNPLKRGMGINSLEVQEDRRAAIIVSIP